MFNFSKKKAIDEQQEVIEEEAKELAKIESARLELEFISNPKYRVRDGNSLDILYCSGEKRTLNMFSISKDKGMIITGYGAISLKNTFSIECNSRRDGNMTICVASGIFSLNLYYSDVSKYFFEKHKTLLQKQCDEATRQFSKILNDMAGNYDYEEVRASQNEIAIMDEILAQLGEK